MVNGMDRESDNTVGRLTRRTVVRTGRLGVIILLKEVVFRQLLQRRHLQTSTGLRTRKKTQEDIDE